jgi:putative ABC transport system permease protein
VNLNQAFKIAAKSIAAKKGRSALTMLGVIIGLAAVIILVSYAQGQNAQMRAYYESLGTNIINIEASSWSGRDLTDDLYAYCMEMDDYVLGVSPKIEMWNDIVIKYGAKTLSNMTAERWEDTPQLAMGNHQFSLCSNYTIAKGRDISYLDVQKYNQVCVLGSHMAELIFNYANPIGQTITINNLPFEVIGVYEEQDPNFMTGKDNYIVVPYTMTRYLNSSTSWSSFVAKAKDGPSTTKAITLLNGFLKGLIGENGYYNVQTPNQWQEQGDEQIKLQQRFLGGIAAISLAVGGIGIMNIMLVTVTERTREIGIRKAIGAERKSIIAQFLIEACMICGIGGLLGILVGYIGTLIVGKLSFNMILLPSAGITVGAFLISVALGIGFGLYPAIKASGLQPVVALRAE